MGVAQRLSHLSTEQLGDLRGALSQGLPGGAEGRESLVEWRRSPRSLRVAGAREQLTPGMVAARHFNNVQIEGEYVIKTAARSVLRGEIHFYERMPPDITHLFPALISAFSADANTRKTSPAPSPPPLPLPLPASCSRGRAGGSGGCSSAGDKTGNPPLPPSDSVCSELIFCKFSH